MFNVDQAIRDAQTSLSLFISVRAMELRLDLAQEFANLRADNDARFDALGKEFAEKYATDAE